MTIALPATRRLRRQCSTDLIRMYRIHKGEVSKLLHLSSEPSCSSVSLSRQPPWLMPPNPPGPIPHWHQMHDGTFVVTYGIVRFHTRFALPPPPSIIISATSVTTQQPRTSNAEPPTDDIDATVGDYTPFLCTPRIISPFLRSEAAQHAQPGVSCALS